MLAGTMLPVLVLAMLAAVDAPRVRIETSIGAIVVELDVKHAPATTANFLRYVEAGLYTGGVFHRTVTMGNQPGNTVKIEVVQAGPRPGSGYLPAIALERTNATGVKHVDGTISMARAGVDTATGDFFICIGDQPGLDFGGARNPDGQGFAAFGRVVEGMDAVRKIQRMPAEGQKLTPGVRIIKVSLVRN